MSNEKGTLTIGVVKYPLLYKCMLVLSVTFVVISGVFTFGLLVDSWSGRSYNDPWITYFLNTIVPWTFVITVIILLLMIFLKSKKSVQPLDQSHYKDFILTEEGLFTRIRTNFPRRAYKYYPWNSLKVYHVNKEKKLIGLKSGLHLIRLSDKHNFNDLCNMVLERINDKTPLIYNRVPFISGLFIPLIIVYLIIFLAVGPYYSSIYNNPPGDDKCDIGGEWAPVILTTNGVTVHEYCEAHYYLYAFLNPLDILNRNKAGLFEQISNLTNQTIIVSFLLWFIMLLLLVYVSISKWYKSIVYT